MVWAAAAGDRSDARTRRRGRMAWQRPCAASSWWADLDEPGRRLCRLVLADRFLLANANDRALGVTSAVEIVDEPNARFLHDAILAARSERHDVPVSDDLDAHDLRAKRSRWITDHAIALVVLALLGERHLRDRTGVDRGVERDRDF